ncbi:hypothetical protein PAAG_01521 [Paracoccidioides lutzii Pb01]|uniref:Uncharacterized protein n=1 Tax=Paracoccidioides lutzii (strain ATCC MYA-826 / Pb01) TaxID=502779 RepID=C1GSM6_PARBA|nr:hypothetical protein PAAG_01521 [Paracoccidioides lutzii Pb01]EEH39059.1 hypothetical protein PAAG_01521 [Paracoccidioides lutzii Pb01]
MEMQSNCYALGPEPEIRPCIAELLRTGYQPPELILRVERVIEVLITSSTTTASSSSSTSEQPKRRSLRIFLSDGELVIQALLGKALHPLALTGEIIAGSVVSLDRFEVRKGERIGEDGGHVVFLAVYGFRCLGGMRTGHSRAWASATARGSEVEKREPERKRKREDDGGNDEDDVDEFKRTEKRFRLSDVDEGMKISEDVHAFKAQKSEYLSENLDRVFDAGNEVVQVLRDYETTDHQTRPGVCPGQPAPIQEPEKCIPQELPILNDGLPKLPEARKPTTPIPSLPTGETAHTIIQNSKIPTPRPFKLPGILKPINRPLNLLTLSQLLHPPKPLPKRNYLCDILAVISWISPTIVKRPHMPPKRDLRIMDPSLEDHQQRTGVSVSVFVNAVTFNPPVGTVGLFRNLKTHEWEGVSLNAYEKDCLGREWFVSERGKLREIMEVNRCRGRFDVRGLEGWWRGRCKDGGDEEGE